VASRFQLLVGQPLWKGNAKTRKAIAAEYARYLGGLGLFYSLAYLMGLGADDDKDKPKMTFDPRSSDFGKVRFGNTTIDPLSGLTQTTVLIGRLATGKSKPRYGKAVPLRGKVPYGGATTTDTLARFLRSKLSPWLGTTVDLLQGENVVGEKVTPTDVAMNSIVPLSFRDVYQVMQEQGIPKGTALSLISLFGMGLQTYKPKPKKKSLRKSGPKGF
jgi:hypothetical protein